ncbi:hypothetical protein QPK31_23950 [Massilia sp. YIM B02769]|uniref:hypothetical protein n=1 Tax=Massilia sp. YIM B02769 TaxID=3050129 RepID=UPI0025B6D76F|nr:hypothetical protein [Massilia sp. YIM B02769]MDN4061277.1 hypothetical protein [Massilia sp. YIM B02769]
MPVQLPLRYIGGDLGLTGNAEASVDFADGNGKSFYDQPLEWALRHIESFKTGLDQIRLLNDAAVHLGLGAHALMGADLDGMGDVWDVLDGSGRVWLKGVTYNEASEAGERFKLRSHWVGDVHIRLSRNDYTDWRHEGPLVLLYHGLGISQFTGIAVRSHVGRCGMMLEEVLQRFDQFSATDQAELMAGLAKHFDLGQEETAGAA